MLSQQRLDLRGDVRRRGGNQQGGERGVVQPELLGDDERRLGPPLAHERDQDLLLDPDVSQQPGPERLVRGGVDRLSRDRRPQQAVETGVVASQQLSDAGRFHDHPARVSLIHTGGLIQEDDVEANGADGAHVVGHLWRRCPHGFRCQDERALRVLERVLELASLDHDPRPHPGLCAMRLEQTSRNRDLREGGGTAALPRAVRHAGHFARRARDRGAQLRLTTRVALHPGPVLPGGAMADVLRVPAREIGDPSPHRGPGEIQRRSSCTLAARPCLSR